MPKIATKQPTKPAKHATNEQSKNGVKPARKRRQKHKPFDEMTLEELTVYAFQLAYERHQRELRAQQKNGPVHA